MTLTQKELLQVISIGENESVEFKTSFQKEVIESIVAFANAKGGKVFIGVDDTGKIVGLELKQESLQSWINQVKQNYNRDTVVL